jgi:ankyrin repeat protein
LKDNDGRTALSFAKENGYEAVVKLLSRAASLRLKATQKGANPGSESSGVYCYEPLSESSSIRLLELHPGNEDDVLSFSLQEIVTLPMLHLMKRSLTNGTTNVAQSLSNAAACGCG